ncbi:hypothetical protein BgAZ_502450 [Babesia gibsoni]|uniref:HIT-type domain-containing protein n=1 Tax=Babesia gibsoni TaxID=33632 RepID=A0AAD8LI95_BABGI|nr:hypothetical protein BgAZ_502450 [Babesia gibsoni]
MVTDAGETCCLCSNAANYRCPSCDRKTCSLGCVTEHKNRFGCCGRRGVSYVPISEMTTETLTRDIALLDETARVIESTSRAFIQRHMEAAATASKRVKMGVLRKCCVERNIELISCPPMLVRHLKNYTSVRKNNVYWTVEWYFPQQDLVLFERRVNERLTLSQAIDKAFERTTEVRLHQELSQDYASLDNVVVLLKDLDSPPKSPKHFLCDLDGTLRDNISHTKILEFPRFEIVLKKDLHLYKLTDRRQLEVKDDTTEIPGNKKLKDNTDESTTQNGAVNCNYGPNKSNLAAS